MVSSLGLYIFRSGLGVRSIRLAVGLLKRNLEFEAAVMANFLAVACRPGDIQGFSIMGHRSSWASGFYGLSLACDKPLYLGP